MTTPKRNEAVARWHMRLNPISGNVYMANEKPAKDLSTEYVLLSDYEALQGEVSRLREALKFAERHCPCGARPESLNTHPHMPGCLIGAALETAT